MFCSRHWSLSASECAAVSFVCVCACARTCAKGQWIWKVGNVFCLAVEHLATSEHTRNWCLRAVRSRTGNIVLAAMTLLPSIVCSYFVAVHGILFT